MRNTDSNILRRFAFHFFAVSSLYIALALVRYPYYLNIDNYFSSDIGMLASTIYELVNGGPIVFYFDFGRTFGLTFALFSAPLMWLMGPTALAFHLPGALYYALYIWTTFLIARLVIPRTAYLVLVLMFFSPFFITRMTMHNWPHTLVAFMGNLIFILFIKLKLYEGKNTRTIFFLFFTMGLAIYTYTYSLIFILVIAVLSLLTHPRWDEMRGKISFATLSKIFNKNQTAKERVCRVFDILIVLFLFFVSFAYVFGGFGLDIGGVSILQINKFHGAAIQLAVLISLRIMIAPKSSMAFFKNVQSYFSGKAHADNKRMIVAGGMGFIIGLSPRIASIVIGETSRGGQGHDTDFLPTKLLEHLYSIFFRKGPQLFDFDKSYQNLVSNPINANQIIFGLLLVTLIVILLASIISFVSENKNSLKSILTFKGMKFETMHIILLAPIMICMANTIVQNGPEPRYLFPLFGILVLWVGIYVDKLKDKFKSIPIIVLAIWVSFYSISNYRGLENEGLINDFKLVKLEKIFIYDLMEFLEKENISVAYSGYGLSGITTYLSGGKLIVSEYSSNPVAKTRKKRSLKYSDFGIIAGSHVLDTYTKFFRQHNIKFKSGEVGEYKVFWEFSGDPVQINKLRWLIHDN